MHRTRALVAEPAWRAVVAMFFLNGALFGVWASRVPAIKDRFALDPAELGLILLALAGGAIVSFPVAGVATDRVGPARLTRGLAAAYVPSLVLVGLSPSVPLLVIAILLFGATFGGMDVAMNGWGAEVERALGRPIMSGLHAMFSLGAGFGAATGYFASDAGLPPAVHFALVALPLGAVALLVAARPWSAPPKRPSAGEAGPALAWPRGALLLVGLIAFGVALGEGALADWSAIYLVSVAGADEATAALGYAVFSAAMVTMRLLGDRVVEIFGAVPTARVSCTVAAAGVGLAVGGATVGLSLAGFLLMGIGYAVVMPLAFSRAARDPEVPAGVAIASVATLGYGGMLVGPPLIGVVAEITSLRIAFCLLALLALVAAVLARNLGVWASGPRL